MLGLPLPVIAFSLLAEAAQPEEPLVINAVGDLCLGAGAVEFTTKEGFDYPFNGTREILRAGDVNFVNLESPFTTRGTAAEKEFTFRTDPAALDAIMRVGFNLFTLANNHILDFGVEGMKDTLEKLDNLKLAHAGAGMNLTDARRPALVHAKGKKVALLAYSLTLPESFYAAAGKPGTAFGHKEWVEKDVAALKGFADIILVSFHWGEELMWTPKPYQQELGHAAIDAGAKVVLGHHPHVLQGIELYRGGIVFYSLGNYSFCSYSKKATRSIVATLRIAGGKIVSAEITPLNVRNDEVLFNPQVLEGEKAEEAVKEVQELSTTLGTTVAVEAGKGRVVMPK